MSDFFAELLVRLLGKTPWFFKVVQIISGIVSVVLLGPDILNFIQGLGITLPSSWGEFVAKAVGVASMVGVFIAQLAVTTDVKQKENIPD